MEHIDYNKFRFRVGDIVTYEGHEYPIVGYFFSMGFNNYRNSYGYTLGNINKYGYDKGHRGLNQVYTEFGDHIPEEEHRWHVLEKVVFKLEEKSGETKITLSKRKRIKFNFTV